MIKDNRYSIRKTKIAVGSVLIASFLAAGAILPSNNNVVSANETVLVTRSDNYKENISAKLNSNGKIEVYLEDNKEYKAGDTIEFTVKGAYVNPIVNNRVQMINRDTGDIFNVGTISSKRGYQDSSDGLKISRNEFLNLYNKIGLEQYSKGKMIDGLNRQVELFERDNVITVTLNENINNFTKDRTIILDLENKKLTDYIYNTVYQIYASNSYVEYYQKLNEILNKKFQWTLTHNNNVLTSGQAEMINFPNERHHPHERDSGELWRNISVGSSFKQDDTRTITFMGEDYNDDFFEKANLEIFKDIMLTNSNPVPGVDYKYTSTKILNPGDLVYKVELVDTPYILKDDVPNMLLFELNSSGTISTIKNERSSDGNVVYEKRIDERYGSVKKVSFTVEKSENTLIFKNAEIINLTQSNPIEKLSVSIHNNNYTKFFSLKENWFDYINVENKTIKNNIKHTIEDKDVITASTSTNNGVVVFNDFGWGENTKGTVKVRFEDEDENPIPNKPERILVDNQIWRTKYSINTAEETPTGYTYIGLKEGSKPLAGIAGDGERIVTLVFKKNVRYISDPTIPTGDKIPNGDGTEIRVGTAPKVEKLPFNIIEEKDPTKPEGYREVKVPGEEGTVTTPYTIDDQGNLVPGTPVRVEPVNEVVVVGTGKETPIPKGVTYIKDDSKPVGEPNTTTPGKDGVRNPDGTVKEEPVNDVVKVPASDKVEKTPAPFTTEYRENPNLPAGEQKEVQAGKDGETIVTTTYTVDPKTGEVIPGTPVTTTIPAVVRIVEVGTKPTTEVLSHNKTTVEDPKKPLTYREVTTPGKDGEKTITYTVDPKTGEVTSTEVIVPAIDEVTTVGTGPNKPISAGVVYEADPELPFGETSTIPGKDGLQDVEGKILEKPTPTVVRIGTKITDEVIPFERVTAKDPEKDIDYKEITTPGVEGKKTTTITVNPKTGEVEKVVDVTPPVTEVTTIGTKPIYTEEWIGDDFAGNKDNDPKVVDSVDIVEEWIDDPYVTDLPEVNNYTIVVTLDGVQISSTDYDMITDVEFMNKLTSVQNELLNDGRNLSLDSLETNGNVATINLKSPDEHKEEWIGDPFAGDKDKDAEVIVSNDVVYEQEWIDDPYVTDYPEINNYTIVVNVDGIQEQTSNFDGITEEVFKNHLTAIKEEMLKDPRKLAENGMTTNGNTITLNYKSPDEYKEEWIGDPFAGDKDKDAEHIVSVDKIIEDLKKEEPLPEKPKEETPVKEVPKVETPKAETPKAKEVKKEEKKLPNTGTNDSSSMLAASVGASLIGFAALAHRRKRK